MKADRGDDPAFVNLSLLVSFVKYSPDEFFTLSTTIDIPTSSGLLWCLVICFVSCFVMFQLSCISLGCFYESNRGVCCGLNVEYF